MKGITVTSAAAAACCLAATTVSASLPSSTTTGTFGIVNNHAFAGLNSRGGAVGEFAHSLVNRLGVSFQRADGISAICVHLISSFIYILTTRFFPYNFKQIEPARKKSSSKKKKKKSTSSQAEPRATSASAATAKKVAEAAPVKKAKKVESVESKDNSKAILNLVKGKNSMQVFLYDAEDGHTVVGMTESAMEDMGIFDGDTVSIKGKRGKKTVATVAMIPDTDVSALDASAIKSTEDGTYSGAIGMTKDAMKNSGVRAGDAVTVAPAPEIKFGKAVLILPYGDSMESAGIDASDTDSVFETYLRPYFEGKFRTLHRGDSFQVNGPQGLIEFQCVEIDSVEVDGDSACVVVDDTVIECDGEPIDRDDIDDLADAGYDAIGGASSHLAAVRELVELPLKHPELWTKLGINTPSGVLLTGPSGCGKTAMARAVAAETGAYFFVINGPEVISKRAGESETNLRRAFEDAEANAADYNGAIVFIDELDSIAPRRDKAGGEVEKRIVSQLLTLMDGLKPSSKVVVIAATNRPSVIEPALRRPGRFDRELDMGIPDEQGRLEIMQIKTRDMRLGKDVDLEILARGSHGFVGADLQQLCMEAALECIR